MTRHDPVVTVRQMLDHARAAIEMARGRRREDIDTDRMLDLALVQLLAVIGRAADNVPEEVQARHSDVPWKVIADRGGRLIREYDTIDFDAVWSVIHDDLPLLVEQLEAIVADDA